MTSAEPTFRTRLAISSLVALSLWGVGINVFGFTQSPGSTRDIRADWILTKAAFAGDDPYADPETLGQRHGVIYQDLSHPTHGAGTAVGFRPPSAFLLLSPVLLTDPDRLWSIALIVNTLLAIAIIGLCAVLARIPIDHAVLLSPLALLLSPVILGLYFGTQSFLIAACLLGSFLMVRRVDSPIGGLLIGVAASLKLFPILLVLPLLMHGRRRAAIAAVTFFALLNVVGLLVLRGVDPRGVVSAAGRAGEYWGPLPGNGALAAFFDRGGFPWPISVAGASVAGAVLLWIFFTRSQQFEARFLAALIIALLVSPLSWLHYDIALVAAGAWIMSRRMMTPALFGALTMWLILEGFALVVERHVITTLGVSTLAGRFCLLFALLLVAKPPISSQSAAGLT